MVRPYPEREAFNPPILHGRSLGECLTLLDSVQIGVRGSQRPGYEEIHRELAVGTVLVSADRHIDTVEACRFNRARLRLSNLDQWVNRSPYRWSRTDSEESIRFLKLPVLQAIVPGGEITLYRTSETLHSRLTDSGFASHEEIEICFEQALTLEQLEYEYVRPLEQLLTLASGTRCVVLDLRVGNDNSTGDMLEGWPMVEFTVRRTNTDLDQQEHPRIRPHMRFGMNDSSYPPNVDFSKILPKWFALQKQLAPVCDLIFSLYSDRGGYLQQQIFTAASAVEALHRRLNPHLEKQSADHKDRIMAVLSAVKDGCPEHYSWTADAIRYSHRKSYAFRVRELIAETGGTIAEIVGNERKWTQQLRDIRDGVGHVLLAQDDVTPEQMVAMLYSARLLTEIVLMRRLGFTAQECQRSLGHHWELPNAKALVEKGFPVWFELGKTE